MPPNETPTPWTDLGSTHPTWSNSEMQSLAISDVRYRPRGAALNPTPRWSKTRTEYGREVSFVKWATVSLAEAEVEYIPMAAPLRDKHFFYFGAIEG